MRKNKHPVVLIVDEAHELVCLPQRCDFIR
jgi:hypothetical protein